MDPLSNYSSINPTYLDFPLSAAQAQQLLQRIGWTYYTIWKKDHTQNPLLNAPGLVWSDGDVNRSLLADQNNLYESMNEFITPGNRADSLQILKACKMGDILQQFYKNCSFLPWGLGISGVALASGRYRWAPGDELFNQISFLSTHNRQPVPSDLREHFFETVVCIPFANGAGVLEMGTNALVPEGDGMLSQMMGFIDRLAVGSHVKEEKILNSALSSGMPAFTAAYIRQSSISSSYCSSSSTPASSPISADQQKGSSSTILNQLGHIELHSGISAPISTGVPVFSNQQPNIIADQYAASLASLDHFYSSPPALLFSATSTATDEYINMQQGHVALDHYLNMQQGAHSGADHYINMQQYAGTSSEAAKDQAPGYGAFRHWSRSLSAVSIYQRKQKKADKDSFLKKLLIFYLPTHSGSTVQINIEGTRAALFPAQELACTSTQMNEAAMNHAYAERNRRRKQAECYRALRTLVPNIGKKDKVATLERSIEYLKELKGQIFELEQAKDALMDTDNEDSKHVIRYSSEHTTSSQIIATCVCLSPSIVKDGNCFQLNANKIIKHEEANMTNIEILSALLKKNLHCIKFRSEFQESTRKLDIEILAKYKKDGKNSTLSVNEIQEIEEWWPKFMMKDL